MLLHQHPTPRRLACPNKYTERLQLRLPTKALIPHLVIDRSYIHGRDSLEIDTGDEAREAACGSCKPLNEKVMALTQPL